MWWSWLCSKLFSLRDVNFGMTSDPSLATLLSNALTCPRPTIHASVTTTWKRGGCDVFYFVGGESVLYDKAQSSGLIKAVKDVRECKTLDGRFALICKGVSVYAPVCPPRTRVSTEDPCVHSFVFGCLNLSSRPETEVRSTWGWTRDRVHVMSHPLACVGGLPWSVVRHLPVLQTVGYRKKVFSSFYILLMWIFNAVLFPISNSHGFTGTERVTKSSRPWLHYICCPPALPDKTLPS